MNGGPYRNTSQSDDRRVINRGGAVSRPSDEPQLRDADMPSAQRVSAPRQPEPTSKKRSNWLIKTVITLVIVIVLAAGGWMAWSTYVKNNTTGIDSTKYQAVFLTNGQIYFGKLYTYNNESMRLTTGYYPQAKASDTGDSDATKTDSTSNGIQLIRMGDEVYGPENEIFISKKQILHYENLKSDSKVSQLIDQNERSK